VLAWLRIREVQHTHVHERAFESGELVCQSPLMCRASVHELPLAAYAKVLRDEGFGQIHRLYSPTNAFPGDLGRMARPTPVVDQSWSGVTRVPSRLRLAMRPPLTST